MQCSHMALMGLECERRKGQLEERFSSCFVINSRAITYSQKLSEDVLSGKNGQYLGEGW